MKTRSVVAGVGSMLVGAVLTGTGCASAVSPGEKTGETTEPLVTVGPCGPGVVGACTGTIPPGDFLNEGSCQQLTCNDAYSVPLDQASAHGLPNALSTTDYCGTSCYYSFLGRSVYALARNPAT